MYRVILVLLLILSSGQLSATPQDVDGSEKLSRTKELLEETKINGASALRPTPREGNTTESMASRMLQGLLLCLGVFFIGTAIAKRLRKGTFVSEKRQMRVIERLSITSKSALVYVEVNGSRYLLSCGGEQVSLIPETAREPQAEEEFEFASGYQAVVQEGQEERCIPEDFRLSA